MPTPTEILQVLAAITNEQLIIAIIWHALIAGTLIGIVLGWRPTKKAGAAALAIPLFSVSILAWAYRNPFNGLVFLIFALAFIALAVRRPGEAVDPPPAWASAIGAVLIIFGWVYPHFLGDGSWLRYLYEAPTGLIPCPTLSFVTGFALLANGFSSRAYSVALGGLGLFYALFGALRLGVRIDFVLGLGCRLSPGPGAVAPGFPLLSQNRLLEIGNAAPRRGRSWSRTDPGKIFKRELIRPDECARLARVCRRSARSHDPSSGGGARKMSESWENPVTVVPHENLVPVSDHLSKMFDIPPSRMFLINKSLAVYKNRRPDSPMFDASQGDGGASLPGVPEELLVTALDLQRRHGSAYDMPYGTDAFRRVVVEKYWKLDPDSGLGPANVLATVGGRDALVKAYTAMLALGHGRAGDLLIVGRVPWISYNWGPYGVGANVLLAPGRPEEGWAYTEDGLRECVSYAASLGRKIAGIIITNPDNPTGHTLTVGRAGPPGEDRPAARRRPSSSTIGCTTTSPTNGRWSSTPSSRRSVPRSGRG